MPVLCARAASARPDKTCHCQRIFMLAPLAVLVVSSMVQAAAPGAGSLGNQLRQEKMTPPAPPVSAPLVLPEAEQVRKDLLPDSHTTLVVKKVVFTGVPAGVRGVDEPELQKVVAGDLNRPLTFAGLEAMVQKVTGLYRHNGLLVARAILPPQTVKDGVLTIQI
ncbi:ShlB/FhaC/HecB family hemolysin secretion/activation protein, partial [Salmonella enterica]|nr:ShlB/FhaC/HecB family hemolysin secretion/activation protein [Salmonella enterica]